MFQNAPLGHWKICARNAGRVGVVVGFFPSYLFSFVHTPLAFGEGCEEDLAQSMV